jgi:hypothetical protein
MSRSNHLLAWRKAQPDVTKVAAARRLGISVWAYQRLEGGNLTKLPLALMVKIMDETNDAVGPRELLRMKKRSA